MRYHFQDGVKAHKKSFRRAVIFGLPAIGIMVSAYFLATAFSPALISMPGVEAATVIKQRLAEAPGTHGDRLYIPQINVDVAILEGEDESVLNKGAWHRQPENGNPAIGGHFVLSAQRFAMGLTPGQTRMQSPFYNIDKLNIGDQLFVDYQGERYGYKVIKKQNTEAGQVGIEESSKAEKLTLYSYASADTADNHDVIIAEPLGKVEKLQVSTN